MNPRNPLSKPTSRAPHRKADWSLIVGLVLCGAVVSGWGQYRERQRAKEQQPRQTEETQPEDVKRVADTILSELQTLKDEIDGLADQTDDRFRGADFRDFTDELKRLNPELKLPLQIDRQ